MRRGELESLVRAYFEACNAADAERFVKLFEPNAPHFLPKGMFGPIYGPENLAAQWKKDVDGLGASWTIDNLMVDPEAGQATAEWTAFKPGAGKAFRGVDLFHFSERGLISEVRVYYATPRNEHIGINELGGFPYEERGWPLPDYPITVPEE